MSNDEPTRLWRVRKTVCQMLAARSYLVPDEDKNIDLPNFKNKYVSGGSNDQKYATIEYVVL